MNTSGSIWRRWDPHIHTPGTTFNDQFSGPDPWSGFIDRLENAVPLIEAIGVTDYLSLDNYEEVVKRKAGGQLPNVGLLFPNVELRYGIGTPKGGAVNFHLLISPDDPDHVGKTKLFLENLTFKAANDQNYRCRRSDLVRLGRDHTGENLADTEAFVAGANQFKVSPDQFLEAWTNDHWIQRNALIAMPASSGDGSGALQEGSLAALRRKLDRAAHIIFSSRTGDRDFWLGHGADTLEELTRKYRGPKPCLHGSDAHDLETVGNPDLDRLTWIKGDLIFETLRQVCIEPEMRVVVAANPPKGAFSTDSIRSVSVTHAPWFREKVIPLNAGLVGIIGSRGSGKTALADLIVAGANSLASHLTKTSFVQRAREPVDLIGSSYVTLEWYDSATTDARLSDIAAPTTDEPRVRYLSQQFVEQLCSARGATDQLVAEIERVIFASHAQTDRMGAENFQDLLTTKAALGRQRRLAHEKAIVEIGKGIAQERNKQDAVPNAKTRRGELQEQTARDRTEREKLVPKDAEAHSRLFDEVSGAATAIRSKIERAKRRLNSLSNLREEVRFFETIGADNLLDDLSERHSDVILPDGEWKEFRT